MKTRDLTIRELILATIALLLVPIGLFFWMDGNGPNDLASLIGAFSALIAVIWFYRGLRLQSIQINEQRQQFTKQFKLQLEDSRLSFLETSSKRLKTNIDDLVTSLNIPDETAIFSAYLKSMPLIKLAVESTDPDEVISELKKWNQIEGPCMKFINLVRDITVLHKLRLGMEDNSEGLDPPNYVFVNSGNLMKQPLISQYETTVHRLSEQMMLLQPGRDAMKLSYSSALALTAPKGVMKVDQIIEEIKEAESSGKLVPNISIKLVDSQQTDTELKMKIQKADHSG